MCLYRKVLVNYMQIKLRDPGSVITHFIGIILALIAAVPLIAKSAFMHDSTATLAMIIFMISMALLYTASTVYHSITSSPKIITIFKKIDHIMIFYLIAGTYTPICLIALPKEPGESGLNLLIAVWSIALVGTIVKAFWVTCPKWVSSIIYIAMGWACIGVIFDLYAILTPLSFYTLLAGGIIYTVGGIIYALKLSVFNNKHKYFGSHEVFHLFVMGGSICHYICIYNLI